MNNIEHSKTMNISGRLGDYTPVQISIILVLSERWIEFYFDRRMETFELVESGCVIYTSSNPVIIQTSKEEQFVLETVDGTEIINRLFEEDSK